MLDIALYWANRGADIIRLDAVAFLWKRMGTTCQNEREAHLILQLMKDCCQVAAPGTLFIAEAIVAPVEIVKYFGEDAVIAKECEIAYNATLMALLWDGIATKNARLLNSGVQNLPAKLEHATWLNYVRCHDDIGLGFDDRDVQAAGYEPVAHRRFLIDFFTGRYPGSPARGLPFAQNTKTGDARISGTLASLVGLQAALETGDEALVERSIDIIVLLHSVIMSFGGIPLLYYGDELGTLNDDRYKLDDHKVSDNRWVHRPRVDWAMAERRHVRGALQQRLFESLQKLIAVRKGIAAFADYNNREIIDTENPHLFSFLRSNRAQNHDEVLVISNFDDEEQLFGLDALGNRGQFGHEHLQDLYSGLPPKIRDGQVAVPPRGFYWLRI
jgi:amylosucrase